MPRYHSDYYIFINTFFYEHNFNWMEKSEHLIRKPEQKESFIFLCSIIAAEDIEWNGMSLLVGLGTAASG